MTDEYPGSRKLVIYPDPEYVQTVGLFGEIEVIGLVQRLRKCILRHELAGDCKYLQVDVLFFR